MKPWLLRMVVTALWIVGLRSAFAKDSNPELKAVIAAWHARKEKTNAIRYEVRGWGMIPKGAFNDQPDFPSTPLVPSEDHTFALTLTYMIDFAQGWFRRDEQSECYDTADRRFVPEFISERYDGNMRRVYQPRAANGIGSNVLHADLALQKDGKKDFRFTFYDLPVLLTHGVVPVDQLPTASQLAPPLKEDNFSIAGKGVLHGQKCIIVKTLDPANQMEYWVDAERDYAVLRAISWIEGNNIAQLDIRYHLNKWGWIPSGWAFTNKLTYLSGELAVTQALINEAVRKSDFEVPLVAGMVVRKVSEQKYYEVSVGGVLEAYPRNQPNKLTIYLLATIVVIGIICGGLFGWRRIQQQRRRA